MKVLDIATGKIHFVVAAHWDVVEPFALKKVCLEGDRSWRGAAEIQVLEGENADVCAKDECKEAKPKEAEGTASRDVSRARAVAYVAHTDQYRRDGITPYIHHPTDVAKRVAPDKDAQIVAWLHDVLEDTHLDADDLFRYGVSPIHIEAIDLLTKERGVSYEDYIAGIRGCPLATKVKLADMASNLADKPTEKQRQKYAEAMYILEQGRRHE
jgi:hypothetical protein